MITPEQKLVADAASPEAAKRAKATDKMGKQMEESYNLSEAASFAFTPILLALTTDSSKPVRVNVFYALSYAFGFPVEQEPGQEGITRAQVIDAILPGLSDKEASVRVAAAGALGQQRAPEGIPALLKALDDPAATNEAIWALGNIGVYSTDIAGKLLGLLPSGSRVTQEKILEALAGVTLEKKVEIEALLPFFESNDDMVRIALTSPLHSAAVNSPGLLDFAIPVLLKAAKDKHFRVRSNVMQLLGVMQVEEALPLFISALNDHDTVWGALTGLQRAPSLAVKLMPQLCKFIGIHHDEEQNACEALGNIGADAAQVVPFLIKTLKMGKASWDGKDVLTALAGIGTDEAMEAVREAAEAGNKDAKALLGEAPDEATEAEWGDQFLSSTAFTAVRQAAESAFPGVPHAEWGTPEWHRLPRWEYGFPEDGLDLSPIAWIERRYPVGAAIPHGHILTVALSNLYDMSVETITAAAADPKMSSGIGIELSTRIALRDGDDLDEWMPSWVVDSVSGLVKYVQETGRGFWYGHYSEFTDPNSPIPGIAFTFDPSFGQIRSRSGTIDILQIVLLTRDETDLCAAQQTSRHFLEVFEETYPDAVNVIGRPSILDTPGNRERILALAAAETADA